jgi:hypothetical protein
MSHVYEPESVHDLLVAFNISVVLRMPLRCWPSTDLLHQREFPGCNNPVTWQPQYEIHEYAEQTTKSVPWEIHSIHCIVRLMKMQSQPLPTPWFVTRRF